MGKFNFTFPISGKFHNSVRNHFTAAHRAAISLEKRPFSAILDAEVVRMADVDKINGKFDIYCNGEYVVLPGSKLYILKTDGSLVACRKDLRYVGRITFLSGNRMLLCSSKGVFHMINLCDGSDIWTAPYTKTNLNVASLAISPDEAYAYTYDEWRGHHFISRLDLQTHLVYSHEMNMDIGGTCGIICDEEGVPCLLKSLVETIGGENVVQNGVRLHNYHSVSPGSTTVWKTKWSSSPGDSAFNFLDSADSVLTTSLHIYEPASGISIDLLENEPAWSPEQPLCECWLDSTGRYLCLLYQTVNVVIDIKARKVAAQYAVNYGRGCLIGNEYWVCLDSKILRKPFPAFEEAPPVKTSINMDWYFSNRPELW